MIAIFFNTRREILLINYINTDEMPNHFTLTFFTGKGTIYVSIATMNFSLVIFTCEDIVFSHKTSPGISLVLIQ